MVNALQNAVQVPQAPIDPTPEPRAPVPAPKRTGEAANDAVFSQTAANDPQYKTPLHTQTQSTMTPTAEFTRIFLLAWIIRYVFRGGAGAAFEKKLGEPGIRNGIVNALSAPGRWLKQSFFPKIPLTEMEAATYAGTVGLGSAYLSHRYGKMVKADIQNIFSEAVALEKGKSPNDISFDDIKQSDNRIISRTVENYRSKLNGRLGTDALFAIAAVLRHGPLTDLFLGFKGIQIFADTWKRKTTMFEDLVTFINNKINPRNGLGQTINVGEIFDLYQHYSEAFNPSAMFTNVLDRGTGEGARWAQSQPIFERMTQLMNLTYAYKHRSEIDATTGHAVAQADFALPKFIYLLGHDLIDVNQPEKTLATIEVANRYGIPAVKEMHRMLASGASIAQVTERYPTTHTTPEDKQKPSGKNGVIPKGSTMQLDEIAPSTRIETEQLAAERMQATQHMASV